MKKIRLLICAFCLVCCCVICFSGCGGQTPDAPASSSAETESTPHAVWDTTEPIEDESGESPQQDKGFVDDRQNGNGTADDLFGGSE